MHFSLAGELCALESKQQQSGGAAHASSSSSLGSNNPSGMVAGVSSSALPDFTTQLETLRKMESELSERRAAFQKQCEDKEIDFKHRERELSEKEVYTWTRWIWDYFNLLSFLVVL